jgi:hypothetical protein
MDDKAKKIIVNDNFVYGVIAITLLLSLYLLAVDGFLWLIGTTKALTFWDVMSSTSIKMRIGAILFICDLIFLFVYEKFKKK